jgi:2-polyprenyl-6-methoxyphenol hydroxylase-like FAD-dependent oxidoreductase
MATSRADFVVAGGGIGGSVLAELLARGGKRVVVLERSVAPPTWTRPEILWPATADFLATLHPRELFLRECAHPFEGFDIDDGRGARALVPAEALRLAGVRPWSTEPNALRELLLERASFEVRRGVEVEGLLREDATGRVVGVRARNVETGASSEIEADWTVGDDGVRSTVRRELGVEIELRMFPIDFLCFGPAWPAALDPSRARVWANRGGTRSGILGLGVVPLPNGHATALVLALPKAFEDPRASEDWQRFLERDRVLSEVVGPRLFPGDFHRVRRPWGHAPRYGAPGALVLGDAAHPVSPAGGQGASAAVGDARTIASLALARSGASHALAGSHDLAAEYERRRRPPNERSIAVTRLVHRIWSLPAFCRPNPVFFALLAFLRTHPQVLARTVRDVSTRFLERPRESA